MSSISRNSAPRDTATQTYQERERRALDLLTELPADRRREIQCDKCKEMAKGLNSPPLAPFRLSPSLPLSSLPLFPDSKHTDDHPRTQAREKHAKRCKTTVARFVELLQRADRDEKHRRDAAAAAAPTPKGRTRGKTRAATVETASAAVDASGAKEGPPPRKTETRKTKNSGRVAPAAAVEEGAEEEAAAEETVAEEEGAVTEAGSVRRAPGPGAKDEEGPK
ncbi:MAG: hypothetical protein Q9173_003913 [Seirophora scorigena]